MGRLLHRSLDAPRSLTQHPASGGARARLARLALLHARTPGASPRGAAALLAQRALRAALLWFEPPPAWYGRWSAAEAREQCAAVADLAAVVAAGGWPDYETFGEGGEGAAAGDPVWDAAAAGGGGDVASPLLHITPSQRLDLLALLLAAETERTSAWADPLALPAKPRSPYAKYTCARWTSLARAAWAVSPRLALALPARLPASGALDAELERLVVQHAGDAGLQRVPGAAEVLSRVAVVGEGKGSATTPSSPHHHATDALALWAPAPLLQALAMLGGPTGGAPPVRAYALRSLEACPPEAVASFLPQLVQLLRGDGDGQIAAYLLAAATRSVLYAHILIATLAAEGTPPAEAFAPAVKRSGWKPPADTGLWRVADELKDTV